MGGAINKLPLFILASKDFQVPLTTVTTVLICTYLPHLPLAMPGVADQLI